MGFELQTEMAWMVSSLSSLALMCQCMLVYTWLGAEIAHTFIYFWSPSVTWSNNVHVYYYDIICTYTCMYLDIILCVTILFALALNFISKLLAT